MTTLAWLTGFEYGLATPVTNGGGLANTIVGTPSVSGSIKRSGGYSLRCQTAAGAQTYIQITTSLSKTTVGFYIYFTTVPSADCSLFLVNLSTVYYRIRFHQSNSNLALYDGTTTKDLGAVTTGVWYRIDMKVDASANPTTAAAKMDGGTEQTFSTSQGASTITYVSMGITTASVNADIYFDDVVVTNDSVDYPLGAHAVAGLRPSGDGTHNNGANILEDSAGADIGDGTGGTVAAYDKLDESPWTSTANADYVRQTANGTANYAEILFADTSETQILGAMALLEYASASATGNTGGCIIIDEDATSRTLWGAAGALADYSESSAFYKSLLIPAPAGGWDMGAVNALKCRFGYSDDANPDPYWLAIMVEVAYLSGPAAQTVNLSAGAVAAGGQALTLAMGAVTKNLANGAISATGPQMTVSAPPPGSTVNLVNGALAAGGQAITLVPGAVSKALQNGVILVSGQAASIAVATTYYVDATTGSDSDDGKSEANAWATIAKVNGFTFTSGDRIWFKKGETWRETLSVPRSDLTFGAYGTGAKPRILGSAALSGWTSDTGHWVCSYTGTLNLIWFKNASDGLIKWGSKKASKAACVAEYDWYSNGTSVWVYAATDPDTRYTAVETSVRDACININGKSNIDVSGLELAYSYKFGIQIYSAAVTGCNFDGNTIHHVGVMNASEAEGILCRGTNHVISNNTIYQCGNHGIYTVALSGATPTHDVIIEGNDVKDCYHTCIDTAALDPGVVYNVTLRYNICYTTNEFADTSQTCNLMYLSGYALNKLYNVDVYYNVLHHTMTEALQIDRYTNLVNIYNNTIYGANPLYTSGSVLGIGIGVNTTDIVLKNNIAFDFPTRAVFMYNGAGVTQCDYNIWFNSVSVDQYVAYGGVDYGTGDFAAYKTASGFDTHGYWENPDLVNPSNNDFRLSNVSPGINTGVNLSLTVDIMGNTVPTGAGPDIGAYEYQIEIALSAGSLTAGGQGLTVSIATNVSLNAGALTANGQALTLAMGAVTKSLAAGAVAANGQAVTISAPAPGIDVNLSNGTLAAGGQGLGVVPGAVSKTLQNGGITASGQVISVLKGAVSVALGSGGIAASGQVLSVVKGAVTVSLDAGLLTAEGLAVSVSALIPGTILLQAAMLTITGLQLKVMAFSGKPQAVGGRAGFEGAERPAFIGGARRNVVDGARRRG